MKSTAKISKTRKDRHTERKQPETHTEEKRGQTNKKGCKMQGRKTLEMKCVKLKK